MADDDVLDDRPEATPLPEPEPVREPSTVAEQLAGLRPLVRLRESSPWWRSRPARVVFALLLVLVPVGAALVSVQTIPDAPADDLLTAGLPPDDRPGLTVFTTLRELDADSGEVTGDLVFAPSRALLDDGRLTRPVNVFLNDARGNNLLTFAQGEPMAPRQVVLGLSGSRSTGYPFDSYRTTVVLGAAVGDEDGTFEGMPTSLDLKALIGDFVAEAQALPEIVEDGANASIHFKRPAGVVFWAVLFMVLCWALAIGCALLTTSSLFRLVTVPFFLWGLFAAILFALPNIRNSLPGDPPFGSVVDWGAFYWSVAMVALALLALMYSWLGLVRKGVHVG